MDDSHIKHFYPHEAEANIAFERGMDDPSEHESARCLQDDDVNHFEEMNTSIMDHDTIPSLEHDPVKSNGDEDKTPSTALDSNRQKANYLSADSIPVSEPNGNFEYPVASKVKAIAKDLLAPMNFKKEVDAEITDPKAPKASRPKLADPPDTLVFIDYPKTAEFKKFSSHSYPFHVHSKNLLATGSKVFEQLLSPTNQFRILRRRKLAKQLPEGIKYVLDLTPPDEGDEAVNIIADLSLSKGIRKWYTMEHRSGINKTLIAGSDESAVTDLLPILGMDSAIPDKNKTFRFARVELSPRNLLEEQADLATALKLSEETTGLANEVVIEPDSGFKFSNAGRLANYFDDIPEYSDIRHRLGIQRLLQLIEGRRPLLDSAPKVWNLWVLAKHFDCVSLAAPGIITWLTTPTNTLFLEVLPEMSAKIGLGIQSSRITKAAFSVLVGEEALSLMCHRRLQTNQEQLGITILGRQREDIDEDLKNRIEYASKAFEERISKIFDNILSKDLSWLEELPEFKKITQLEKHIGGFEDKQRLQWVKCVRRLRELITSFIHRQILFALSKPILHTLEGREFIAHRSHDTLLLNDWGNANVTIELYNRLIMQERVFTRTFWLTLRRRGFTLGSLEHPFLCNYLDGEGKEYAIQNNICTVTADDLALAVRNFDTTIIDMISTGYLSASELRPEVLPLETDPPASFEDEPKPKKARFDNHERTDPVFTDDVESALAAFELKSDMLEADYSAVNKEYAEYRKADLAAERKANALQEWVADLKTMREADRKTMSEANREIMDEAINRNTTETWHKLVVDGNPSYQFLPGHENQDSQVQKHGDIDDFGNKTQTAETAQFPGFRDTDPNPLSATPATVRPFGNPLSRQVWIDNVFKSRPDYKQSTIKSIKPTTPFTYPSEHSPFLNIYHLLEEIDSYFEKLTDTMLNTDNIPFNSRSTDVLVCLTDNEFKYLPDFVGGQDDGTGAVFTEPLPEGVSGLVPIGPGPFFKTEFSVGGSSCFGTDTDSEVASTVFTGEESGDGNSSRMVEDGFEGAFPKSRVMGNEDMGSIAWSDDGSADAWENERLRSIQEKWKGKGKISEMGPIFTPGTSTIGNGSVLEGENGSVVGETNGGSNLMDYSTQWETPKEQNYDDDDDNDFYEEEEEDQEDVDEDEDDDNDTTVDVNEHMDVEEVALPWRPKRKSEEMEGEENATKNGEPNPYANVRYIA